MAISCLAAASSDVNVGKLLAAVFGGFVRSFFALFVRFFALMFMKFRINWALITLVNVNYEEKKPQFCESPFSPCPSALQVSDSDRLRGSKQPEMNWN